MQFQIQVKVVGNDGEPVLQEVVSIARGPASPETLGMTLQESKAVLRGLQKAIVQEQIVEQLDKERACPHCAKPRPSKQTRQILLRTVFGNLRIPSPRWHRCSCEKQASASATFSPLALLLPERTSPELLYLETKWASLVSYGVTGDLLHEVLPVDEKLSPVTIRNHLLRVAGRCEQALGDEQFCFLTGCPRDWAKEPIPDGPFIVGLDGGYVRARKAKQNKSTKKTDIAQESVSASCDTETVPRDSPGNDAGCFEVITGRSILSFRRDEPDTATPSVKRFGLVNGFDDKPKRRLFEVLSSQGLQPNQQVTFLSDGGDSVRTLQSYLSRESEHYLDWFHLTMRLTVLSQCARGIDKEKLSLADEDDARLLALDTEMLEQKVQRLKHYLWHGNVACALDAVAAVDARLDLVKSAGANAALVRRMQKYLREFEVYLDNNRSFLPNYGERYRNGETISTAFVESTINEVVSKRMVKKQQMQWTPQGAHLLLQTRVRVLDAALEDTFRSWYPGFRPSTTSPQPVAA